MTMVNDRTIIDLIKENTVLKEQIVYENRSQIESLLTELKELKKNSNNEHSFYNQEQNTPSKYSPTNTVTMMLSNKYANHDNIN